MNKIDKNVRRGEHFAQKIEQIRLKCSPRRTFCVRKRTKVTENVRRGEHFASENEQI